MPPASAACLLLTVRIACCGLALPPLSAAALKFDFGRGPVAPGFVAVTPATLFGREQGYGFEPGAKLLAVDRGGADPLRGDFITSDTPFHFTARVPREGNYLVSVTLGDAAGESTTTIKAELRRLMVEKISTARGAFQTVRFVVNTRTPAITAAGDIKPGAVRLDKILSLMRPGDWLLMQFGHNDQKQIAANSGGPFTTYPTEIRRHVEGVRHRGGVPIILSPMERRGFDDAGRVRPSLREYADAARQTAQELGVAFIDLNALSRPLYEALGVERSALAFAAPGGKVDNTHHNNFGSYQLAKCIVQTLRELKLPVASFIADDFPGFDPARPDDPAAFAVPASGEFTNQRPLGDEGNK